MKCTKHDLLLISMEFNPDSLVGPALPQTPTPCYHVSLPLSLSPICKRKVINQILPFSGGLADLSNTPRLLSSFNVWVNHKIPYHHYLHLLFLLCFLHTLAISAPIKPDAYLMHKRKQLSFCPFENLELRSFLLSDSGRSKGLSLQSVTS